MDFAIFCKPNLTIVHNVQCSFSILKMKKKSPTHLRKPQVQRWVREKNATAIQPKKCQLTAQGNSIMWLETDKQDLSDTELSQILQASRCHKLYQQK